MNTILINFGAAAAICFTLACTSPPQSAEARNIEKALVKPDSNIKAKRTAAAADPVMAADLARIQGKPKAPVWLLVISDFQCPSCKYWHDEVYPLVRKEFIEPGKVRLAYVNFPLRSHRHAIPAAEAAMCAGAQNKFWAMQDAIFATQEDWTYKQSVDTYFESLAKKIGVDVAKLRNCVQSDAMRGLIETDYTKSVRAGVEATPTIIVQNKLLQRHSIESIREAVNTALASSGKE